MLLLRARIIAEFECFMFYIRNIKPNRLHLGSIQRVAFPPVKIRVCKVFEPLSAFLVAGDFKKLLY